MAHFQRRHYETIARILKDTRGDASNEIRNRTLDVVIARFVAEFAADNPNFQAGRFRDAAGYEEGLS